MRENFMAKFKTHYDNLNVSRNAPASVIKAAYKTLCQNYHPDKYTGGSEEALRIIKIINAAYAVLSDPDKRAEHDQWINKQEREQAADEAQRVMTLIAKAYVAPPATSAKNPAPTDRATADKSWRIGINGLSARAKKINWLVLSAGIAGIALIITFLYASDNKTSAATVRLNQEIAQTLKKAKLLVKQGHVLKALPLYLPLAEQGNAEAQFQIGLIYVNGLELAKDDKQAVAWFSKAAKRGHKEAQTKLGFMYATGKGVERNYNLAFYWCYKAAEQGDVIAQYNLGLMYAKGQGVVKDNSLAVSWYGKAAAQGDAHAQYNLGEMYANGVGVAKDNKQAADLYRKAAKQGLTEAIAALKQLAQ